jgi:MFS family permease
MLFKFRQSFTALRHRNFRLFVVGQFISLVGFWMQAVGQSWLVYRLTGSAVYLGAIAFSQQIPVLLFAFAAGGLVDRTNRHRMVMVTQTAALLQSGVLAVLTWTGRITIPHLFILAALMGIISAFDLPARQAFLIQMVGRDDLMNAIAINSSMFNAARMIGPAIAGLVVARWGEAVTFFSNSITYLAVLVSLLAMHILPQENGRRQSLRREIIEGLAYIRSTRPVRSPLMLIGALGFGGFPFVVLLPIFADRIFGRGASGLGWLMTATGAGALSGALYLASRSSIRGINRLISISAFGFSLCLLLFSTSTHFWLSLGILVFLGIFMMIITASINTAIQSIIPDALRGRVMSLFTTMVIGTAPLGSLVAGAVARTVGVRPTLFAMSCLCLAAAFWFYRRLPRITSEAHRMYQLQNPPLPGEPLPTMSQPSGS